MFPTVYRYIEIHDGPILSQENLVMGHPKPKTLRVLFGTGGMTDGYNSTAVFVDFMVDEYFVLLLLAT